ncbi:NIPSNAP family protein [Gordonia sp. SCSIO 19800]|uniref:NIPSNAP family protein n=1 Tax=Gordonia sp. SCSIO 19800 TaxID=2826926 RepID=UPI001B8300F5|nr:NIPSNAP family protein [Gordonia sp. SCSIO 19800]MBR7194622.1 NIPSNAP family protein [Gordonia sp. SCSIO 19800]
MIYELREYTAVPGMLPRLVKRFNEHTLRLFAKHGMEVAFIGHTAFGEDSVNELVYALKFTSYADIEEKWNTFLGDPEWLEAKAASEADGPLITAVRRRVINPAMFQ